jgi:hypothetical protein
MALKDFYVEKAAVEDSGSLSVPDNWALDYINIGRARDILEAFDDDAGGFVTVNEVNTFTRSRPRKWRCTLSPSTHGLPAYLCFSLLRWIAYWAIGNLSQTRSKLGSNLFPGWQMTCTTYCTKIEEVFDAMIHLASRVLPENRRLTNIYITAVWHFIMVFVQSIEREEGTQQLRSKFQSHVTAEETRLRQNLEEIKYVIDDSDTLRVIAGEGRIEMASRAACDFVPPRPLTPSRIQTLFPMSYLVLKRGLEKLSLAREHVLSENELHESIAATRSIARAAVDRIDSLKSESENRILLLQS